MEAKYKKGDLVKFKLEDKLYSGTVYIVDHDGIWEDKTSVYYDILSETDNCLYKHIRENLIVSNKQNPDN